MLTSLSSLLLLVSTFCITTSAHYELQQDYTGQNFFSNFDFYNGPDPTNGHVEFIGDATANVTGLAGLVHYSNASKPSDVVFLGVDNSTVLPIDKGRRSLRMQSVQTFNQSLVIVDILHQPSNVCGVWPAFWMLGTSATWPAAGEIDIVEGVNDVNFNRISMHTNAGLDVVSQDGLMLGKMKTTNCDVAAAGQDKNAGCMVDDSSSTGSYGAAFNQMQGGVFAMEYTTDAVKVWFFKRTRIPEDIAAGMPSPPSQNGSDFHAWGKPTALFQPSAQSNLTAHLRDLQLIFDTTFCGDWAGKVWNTTACAQLAPTCEEYVSKNPRAFDEAYWLIQSLQVFSKDHDDNTDNSQSLAGDHTHKKRSIPGGLSVPGKGPTYDDENSWASVYLQTKSPDSQSRTKTYHRSSTLKPSVTTSRTRSRNHARALPTSVN